jgi:hypothetical protein
MKRRSFLHCALGTASLAGFGWHAGHRRTEAPHLRKVSRSGRALGTQVHITVFAASEAQGEEAIRHAILDTGEVGTLGHNAGHDHKLWAASIQHPREPGLLGIVHLDQRCLATSGVSDSTHDKFIAAAKTGSMEGYKILVDHLAHENFFLARRAHAFLRNRKLPQAVQPAFEDYERKFQDHDPILHI